jgi:hypothetical protein
VSGEEARQISVLKTVTMWLPVARAVQIRRTGCCSAGRSRSDGCTSPTRADPRRIEVRFTGERDGRTPVKFELRRLERYAGETQRMRSVLHGPNGASGVLAAYAG